MECLRRLARETGINLDAQPIAAEVDKALCMMLDQMFLEGEDLSKAQYMTAAVMFKCPYLRSPKQMLLPVSKQCLQGWRKLDPPRSRLPLPWEVACPMAEYMMKNNMVQEGLMMLLGFVLYLRPGEIVKTKCQDLIPPTGQGRQEANKWALLLHRQEEKTPSKTAGFDETLLFDLPYTEFAAAAVHQWRSTSTRPQHLPIFTKTAADLRSAMSKVATQCNLEVLGDPHPYRLRNGGASRDFATGDRQQPDVQRGGRWKTASSTRRYEKGGRLNQLLMSLPKRSETRPSGPQTP